MSDVNNQLNKYTSLLYEKIIEIIELIKVLLKITSKFCKEKISTEFIINW